MKIGMYTGFMNYQGDLNPNSFSLSQARFAAGVVISRPISGILAWRAGFLIGKTGAADRYNREYLKPRNLSFFSTITELHAALEITFVDINRNRLSPYIFAGVAFFHFNPWTFDDGGKKVYLKPLSTEGQGIQAFPSQKPYNLSQIALPYGLGLRFRVTNDLFVNLEFSQRKTFTDYLDDVSSFYVDQDILLAERGQLAVELGYRGSGGYPPFGEQRGTPTENDWYYTGGITIQYHLRALAQKLGIAGKPRWKCPTAL